MVRCDLAQEPEACAIQQRVGGYGGRGSGRPLRLALGAQDTQLSVVFRQRYPYRTRFGATSAKRAGVGQIRISLHPPEKRRENVPHWPRIYGFVGMPAHCAVDRTLIEAGPAVQAVEYLPEGTAGQKRSAIIEKHHMKLFGSLLFARLSGARYDGDVARDRLTRGGACEQGEKAGKIGYLRDDFIDSQNGNLHRGKRCGHPSVSFVGHKHQRPGLGNGKICAGNSDLRGEETVPEGSAGGAHEAIHVEAGGVPRNR